VWIAREESQGKEQGKEIVSFVIVVGASTWLVLRRTPLKGDPRFDDGIVEVVLT
jgi:hypothetical protein